MDEPQKSRTRAIGKIRAYFSKGFLRQTLTIIILLTGVAGIGLSYGLLKTGLDAMWLRYPIAVLGAYGIFLLLIRLWVELERRRIDPSNPVLQEDVPDDSADSSEQTKTNLPRRKSSWLDYLDIGDVDLPADEGCLIALLLALGAVLIALVFAIVMDAPALLSEVFVDALLTGALYRRLRIAAKEHWLGTAIRKTWPAVICAALLLGLGGLYLSLIAPGTKTLGTAIEQIRKGPETK